MKIASPIVFLFWLLSGLCVLCSCQPGGEQSKKQEKTTFTDSLGIGKDPELLDWTKKITEGPQNPDNFHGRALVFLKKRRFREAMTDLQSAFMIDSSNALYFTTLFQLNLQYGALQQAENAIERSLKLNPKLALAWVRKGELHYIKKEYDKAFDAINTGLKIEPTLAEGYYWKGMIYLEQKAPLKSMSSFQTAVELNPDYYEPYLHLAQYYLVKKDTLGLRYLDNAIRADSTRDEAWYAKGMYFQENGRKEEAREAYQSILRYKPDNAYALFNLGYLSMEKKQFDEAIDYFSRSYQSDNAYLDALYNRGYCFLLKGEKQRAKLDFDRVLELNPEHSLSLQRLKELKL